MRLYRVSGTFMLRDGHYKYIHYVGHEPELYDLNSDPEEMTNLAADPEYLEVLKKFETRLREILDPEAINDLALADQAALIERHGGVEKILERGGLYGTPAPSGPSTRVAAKVS